ncbi:hypothetical protein D3C79_590720 [compost metagenome]
MAFQLHPHRTVATPAAQDTRQGGQQQVVDLGVIGRWRLLEQLSGLVRVQAHAEGLRLLVQVCPLWVIARQLSVSGAQLGLPPVLFVTQRITAGIGQQPCGPIAHGPGFRAQRLTTVKRLQVFEQDSPRHTVDHQVMDCQQQALLAMAVLDQQGAQQRPLVQVETALHVTVKGLAIGKAADRYLPEQFTVFSLDIITLPLATLGAKAQTQRIVLHDQLLQSLLQRLGQQALDWRQQQRLVPVLRLRHIAVEEPVLYRRQCRAPAQRALVDLTVIAAAHHRVQGLDSLVLE